MIDHLTLSTENYLESKKFYQATLAPLGYTLIKEFAESVAGFGLENHPEFWLAKDIKSTRPNIHIAFAAQTRL